MKSTFSFLLLFMLSPTFAHAELKIVPNKNVCMVTDMDFGKPQIPVEVSGKTYYGCCQNCKKTLAEDGSARVAQDPISKKSVDKAKAVIAAQDDGSVLYFENENNFKKFKASAQN
ncbi:MAG: TRASH domain-containing protein [Bdellovibrionales bacterium]